VTTRRRAIRDAYLSPFTDFAPMNELLAAFELSRQLNRPYQVIRWYDESRHVEPASPFGRPILQLARDFLKGALKSKRVASRSMRGE
jgi:hypothetical protein